MRPREVQSWQSIGASLAALATGARTPPSDPVAPLRRLLELLPLHTPASPALPETHATPSSSQPIPAPSGTEPPAGQDKAPQPNASSARLPAPGAAISIFAIDPARVQTGLFFQSLSFHRNDPTREIPQFFAQAAPPAVQDSCRQFFAYSIPWQARGGTPTGPTEPLLAGGAPGFQSLENLAAAATSQALHLASKLRREQNLLAAYTSSSHPHDSSTAATFFAALPWTGRRPQPTPEPSLGLQS
ncbi:MAG: hypothetical protein SNJ84_06920 [Verrucomicrobiia bacterium]